MTIAYGMQLRARRKPLHAAVASAIEQFDWGRRDEFAGLLAHHYEATLLDPNGYVVMLHSSFSMEP